MVKDSDIEGKDDGVVAGEDRSVFGVHRLARAERPPWLAHPSRRLLSLSSPPLPASRDASTFRIPAEAAEAPGAERSSQALGPVVTTRFFSKRRTTPPS